jgi:hypothetical protein
MDGLEDQAEAAIEGIIDQLFTNDKVEIKHSSRDSVMLRVADALRNHYHQRQTPPRSGSESGNEDNDDEQPRIIVAKKVVFRSGVSLMGLQRLQEALQQGVSATATTTTRNVEVGRPSIPDTNQTSTINAFSSSSINELEFVCLATPETLQAAIQCCRASGIRRLSLKNYGARVLRQNRDLVSLTIRSALWELDNDLPLEENEDDTTEDGVFNHGTGKNLVMLEYLEIVNYPIGADGAQLLAEALSTNQSLKTLKLVDCDLRSDSATPIARILKENHHLEVLDLSYNRHYLGSPLTREMTLKTLVERGLKHNLTLMELHMEQHPSPHQSSSSSSNSRQIHNLQQPHIRHGTKLEEQLDISRFRKAFVVQQRDPLAIHPNMWCHLLGRVSAKPMALYLFLQESVPTLLSSLHG